MSNRATSLLKQSSSDPGDSRFEALLDLLSESGGQNDEV